MIQGINHITLAVKDIEKSFQFYRDVLGLKPLCIWNKGAYFLAGETWFCLNVDGQRIPTDCYTHYAFTVSLDSFETLKQHILKAGAALREHPCIFSIQMVISLKFIQEIGNLVLLTRKIIQGNGWK